VTIPNGKLKVNIMHKTRIDISEKARRKLVGVLSARLADAIDMALQTKQAHWNVKGPRFIALHELFDRIAEVVEAQVDELAERITTLGGVAEGTAQAVVARSSLKPYPLDISGGNAHLGALADALAKYGAGLRAAIETADELGDAVTADLYTSLAADVDKQLWFVEAHLQAKD
jgi:starvation-inducible DNA-binding protein